MGYKHQPLDLNKLVKRFANQHSCSKSCRIKSPIGNSLEAFWNNLIEQGEKCKDYLIKQLILQELREESGLKLRTALEGANLFLTVRTEDALNAVKEQLSHYGNEIHVCASDVSKPTAVQKSVEEAISSFGNIDILVNNAGIHKVGGFLDHSLEEFDQIMEVSIYGVFHVCQTVIPAMKSQGHGKVINIASTAGKAASRNQSAYNTSKHAVVGLTRCLALEMA